LRWPDLRHRRSCLQHLRRQGTPATTVARKEAQEGRPELEMAKACLVGMERERSSSGSELGLAIDGGDVHASSERVSQRERRASETAWSMRHSGDSEVGRQGCMAEEVRVHCPTWMPQRH
jgi:hypothetical protein